jgi:hypothetical protein
VDSHRRQKHSRPQGRLTPDQEAKLDRLAELARYNPDILEAIQQRIDSDMRMEILTLSTDELDALSDQLGLDPQ